MEDREAVALVMDDIVEPAFEPVGRARRHHRAVEVEQCRRDRGRKTVGQPALVMGALVDQRQMVPPAATGARGV